MHSLICTDIGPIEKSNLFYYADIIFAISTMPAFLDYEVQSVHFLSVMYHGSLYYGSILSVLCWLRLGLDIGKHGRPLYTDIYKYSYMT